MSNYMDSGHLYSIVHSVNSGTGIIHGNVCQPAGDFVQVLLSTLRCTHTFRMLPPEAMMLQ